MPSQHNSAAESSLIVVGGIARIDRSRRVDIARDLDELVGVTTFELSDQHQLGVLVEGESLDQAHERVTDGVRGTSGVLAVWPIAIEIDEAARTPSHGKTGARP